jgi:hypothetical protein
MKPSKLRSGNRGVGRKISWLGRIIVLCSTERRGGAVPPLFHKLLEEYFAR